MCSTDKFIGKVLVCALDPSYLTTSWQGSLSMKSSMRLSSPASVSVIARNVHVYWSLADQTIHSVHVCMYMGHSRSRPYTPSTSTLAHVHVRLHVAREIIAFLSMMDTYIHTYKHTYIETISEMRCGISYLTLRRNYLTTLLSMYIIGTFYMCHSIIIMPINST